MTSTTSTILPAFVQAIIDDADQAVTLTLPQDATGVLPDGAVSIIRAGHLSVRIKHEEGAAIWHEHEDEASAIECFDADVAHVQSRIDFLTNGGDPIALALSAQTGMPLEMAAVLAPQVRAQMEGDPSIPVPSPAAVGRAQVPVRAVSAEPASTEYLDGMYL